MAQPLLKGVPRGSLKTYPPSSWSRRDNCGSTVICHVIQNVQFVVSPRSPSLVSLTRALVHLHYLIFSRPSDEHFVHTF